jgi:hypothetical protein
MAVSRHRYGCESSIQHQFIELECEPSIRHECIDLDSEPSVQRQFINLESEPLIQHQFECKPWAVRLVGTAKLKAVQSKFERLYCMVRSQAEYAEEPPRHDITGFVA